ncbi:MAG: ATP-binding response regulator [Arenicella sp.]
MSLTRSQTQKLKALMLASHKPAYFVMNAKLELLEWSNNLEEYGFTGLRQGVHASDVFDFMVGYDGESELELPIVSMPAGMHCSISSVRDNDQINILILDASHDFEQQYQLQQKANDAQLYNMRLQKLMQELFNTQKLLESKNQQLAEAARLQSRFLSGVSHEFRTPLTSLIGFTEVLHGKVKDQESIEQLNIVRGSAKYMLSLVENLLDHGRLDSSGLSLQFTSVKVSEWFSVIVQMLEPLAHSKGLTLTHEFKASEDLLVSIDHVRVQQCVINIANNAIKFTEKGSVNLSLDWQDNMLHLMVTDTGIGMDADETNSLFSAFWQSKKHEQPGTGLGMTITQKLLELMGGEISVKSEPGKGSSIGFYVPAAKAEDNAPMQQGLVIKEPIRDYKVLVVEDDDDIADLIELRLTSLGYRVNRCKNGHECIKWVKDESADVILLDLNMPIMNGEETLKYLRSIGCKTPTYIMSARQLDEGVDIGAQGQLLKPVDFDVLAHVLEECFAEE